MNWIKTSAAAAALALMLGMPSQAAELRIAPVSIKVPAPQAATSVSVTNDGSSPVALQARIFSWRQMDEGDKFFKTKDVVVSPPLLKLAPGQSGVVRLVRLSKEPITGEESYRLLLDELPRPTRQDRSTVNIVMRHSLPVFFSSASAADALPAWKAVRRKGSISLVASNPGGTHVRLSGLSLADSSGRQLSFGSGLNGYVLSNGTRTFQTGAGHRLSGKSLFVTAQTDTGPIRAEVPVTR